MNQLVNAACALIFCQLALADIVRQGTYTFYTGPFDAGACGYGKFVNTLNLNIVAAKTPGNGGADAIGAGSLCGQCAKVCIGGFCKVLHVVDACPSCDDGNHIDLASNVFFGLKSLNDKNKNFIPGKGDMQLQYVDCKQADTPIGTVKITVLQYTGDVLQFGIAADNGVYSASIIDAKAPSGKQQGPDSLKLHRFSSQFFAFQLIMNSSTRIGDYSEVTLNVVCNGQIGGSKPGKNVAVKIQKSQLAPGAVIDTGVSC